MHHLLKTRHWPGKKLAYLASALAFLAAGCGDGPICPSDISLTIFLPSSQITYDLSSDPGVQIDIPVRSNLGEGDTVVLVLLDSSGAELASQTTQSDANGDARFSNVTLPDGVTRARVTGETAECGSNSEEIALDVLVGKDGCGFTVREQPIDDPDFAPLGLLNSAIDAEPNTVGFQATLDVVTLAGFRAEAIAINSTTATETSLGIATADDAGAAALSVTLDEGQQALYVVCRSSAGTATAAAPSQFFVVDTEAPACDLSVPADGVAIIPAMDINDALGDTQIALTASVAEASRSEVEVDGVTFSVNGDTPIAGSQLDQDGKSTTEYTFVVDGSYEIEIVVPDVAGNRCVVKRSHTYVTQGCLPVTLTSPLAPVTTDKNGNPGDGIQLDLVVDVDSSQCTPDRVETDCGSGAVAPAPSSGGGVTLEITICDQAVCEVVDNCTVSVFDSNGIQTDQAVIVVFDNKPPAVALNFEDPASLNCNGQITPADDVDNTVAGVQIAVRVISPIGEALSNQSITITDSAGTPQVVTTDGEGRAQVTIPSGVDNHLVASADDTSGNTGQTTPCKVSLVDLAINFDPPVDDGELGGREGTVSGTDPKTLTLDICGTVSETPTSVEVAIDDDPAQTAELTGGAGWCLRDATLSEGSHTVTATAMAGPRRGELPFPVAVDLTPPGPIVGLTAVSPDRQAAILSFTAPDNDGEAAAEYIIKMANEPLDGGNFDTTGNAVCEVLSVSPSAPGLPETCSIEQLRGGIEYYFAVAALDALKNRTAIATAGPIKPDFVGTPAIESSDPGAFQDHLGYQMASGDFNGDGHSDLAIAAPFRGIKGPGDVDLPSLGAVYVYFGSTAGLGDTIAPNVTIDGVEVGGNLGQGLTTIRWNNDTVDDLAMSAPFTDRVYIFFGGSSFAGITGLSDADVQVGVNPTANALTSSLMGWSIATARFDSDQRDDLVMSAPFGDGGNGDLVVLYGGTAEPDRTTILLSPDDATGSGDARALIIQDANTTTADLFGNWVYNLGRTEGTSDTRDDIAVAYFNTVEVLVIRGRAQPGTTGTSRATFDSAIDLIIQHTDTADSELYFGSAMGSIPDLGSDGGRDIVVGAWGETVFNSNDGRVYILDGAATGTIDVSSAITRISASAPLRKFGTAVVNNAVTRSRADINNDGAEDLLIVGGSEGGGDTQLFVWYGNTESSPLLPQGDIDANTAHHTVLGPAEFKAPLPAGGQDFVMKAIWAGDINNDGLEDVCWADLQSPKVDATATRDGIFQVLSDT
ncbi:MAG: integrin alpha [Proteobacteria bacterium]|nr:integrin alpha [Pseudomonadota bacterium]